MEVRGRNEVVQVKTSVLVLSVAITECHRVIYEEKRFIRLTVLKA